MLLEGKKCTLRDWKIKDLETYEYWQKGHPKWMELDAPYYHINEISDSKLKEIINKKKLKIEANDFTAPRQQLAMVNKADDLLGMVSWYWQSKETYWLSIGLLIFDPKNWGKGTGYDALTLWINYLFETNINLVRLDLRTWSGNIGMMKLAEKLGFKLEARFRDARIVNGDYYDSIGYGLLKSEWSNR